jgi:hypothetical protein
MDNLVFNCTDALIDPNIPLCATDYGERIVAFAVMKTSGTFTVAASDGPTAAEVQANITGLTLAYYNGISNGHKIEGGATELSGDDTVTGGTERWDVMNICEGRLKLKPLQNLTVTLRYVFGCLPIKITATVVKPVIWLLRCSRQLFTKARDNLLTLTSSLNGM